MKHTKPLLSRWLPLALLALCAACGGGSANSAADSAAATPATPVATTGMRNLTSTQLAQQMGVGWNLGNALEATGGETAWGNAATTQALMDAVKAAGFKTVRMPVAWKQYADANDTISPTWLARVQQVVGYAQKAGLYAIINIHWDGGWMQPTYAAQASVNARITTFWTQIGNHFKAFDDTLLFACTNEVMKDGDYGTPTVEYRTVQNSFNQTCVNAVRATGGNNSVRHLVVQGFNTNIDHTVNFAVLPTDSTPQRLMMEVHYYDPYRYTLDENSPLWQWGAGTTDPSKADTWGNEAWADAQFQKMKVAFGDKGVPVILGEFGVIARPAVPGSEAYREAWNRHVAKSARQRGLVPVYWDNGATGRNGMGLFDRSTGRQVYPQIIKALVDAAP